MVSNIVTSCAQASETFITSLVYYRSEHREVGATINFCNRETRHPTRINERVGDKGRCFCLWRQECTPARDMSAGTGTAPRGEYVATYRCIALLRRVRCGAVRVRCVCGAVRTVSRTSRSRRSRPSSVGGSATYWMLSIRTRSPNYFQTTLLTIRTEFGWTVRYFIITVNVNILKVPRPSGWGVRNAWAKRFPKPS